MNAPVETRQRVGTLAEALDRLHHVNFIVYEASGRRRDGGGPALASTDTSSGEEDSGAVEFEILIDDQPEWLAVRARATASSPDAVVVYDVAALYRKDPEFDFASSDIVTDFVESVGFMAVVPYVRSGIHELSTRLGVPPINMGLIHRSDVHVDLRGWEPSSPE